MINIMTMKIAFFEIEDWEKEYLKEKLKGHEVVFFSETLSIENVEVAERFDVISVFICSVVTKEVLAKLPKLKLVTTRSTGFDHIDTAYCKEKKIVVSNVPHYGTHTVAEHTFALILALSRKLFFSMQRTKSGEFDHQELTGFDLYGKTIGIVGLGDIGVSVAYIAKGFGMKIVAYARHPSEDLANRMGVSFLSLKELLAVSDIVTLHVPYTPQTHHMINKRNIKQFKKGSFLINTARGGLVDTEALLFGLEQGVFSGVGLDVLEEENLIKEERQLFGNHCLNHTTLKTLYYDHVLMKQDNVVITPHNAFNSVEALHMILDVTSTSILDFLQGKIENTV
jgi:D-lactate dehydrogenase